MVSIPFTPQKRGTDWLDCDLDVAVVQPVLIAFLYRNTSTNGSPAFVAVPAWFITEIGADAPTDSLVNVDGALMSPQQVPPADTYCVNAQMYAGRSAADRIVDVATAAVFSPA